MSDGITEMYAEEKAAEQETTHEYKMDDSRPMKGYLLDIVKRLRGDGYDLKENAAHVEWAYPEEPLVGFGLVIWEVDGKPADATAH